MILYKLLLGNFKYHQTNKLPGMKLLHYYPLYMYDTDTAVVPDVVKGVNQSPLALTESVANTSDVFGQSMFRNLVLNTLNPNTPQRFLTFSFGREQVAEDLPFFDRSFMFKFDIISCSDDGDLVESRFEMFEFGLFNETTLQLLKLRVYFTVKLRRAVVLSEVKYEGTLQIRIEFIDDFDTVISDDTLVIHKVSTSSVNPEAIKNLSKQEPLRIKYEEMGFYQVLSQQTIIINVRFL